MEWSESEHAKSSERIDQVKQFLAQESDDFRKVYERNEKVRPRRCVFGGTSNDKEMLHDTTGSRRFYIIDVAQEMDLKLLKEIREQVLAQALDIWTRHKAADEFGPEWHATRWWMEREEQIVHRKAMIPYMSNTPWDEQIENWIHERCATGEADRWRIEQAIVDSSPEDRQAALKAHAEKYAFTISDVLTAIGITPDKRNRGHENNLRRKLQSMMCDRWNGGETAFLGGKRGRFWLGPMPEAPEEETLPF